jgi:hypothetical protein
LGAFVAAERGRLWQPTPALPKDWGRPFAPRLRSKPRRAKRRPAEPGSSGLASIGQDVFVVGHGVHIQAGFAGPRPGGGVRRRVEKLCSDPDSGTATACPETRGDSRCLSMPRELTADEVRLVAFLACALHLRKKLRATKPDRNQRDNHSANEGADKFNHLNSIVLKQADDRS